MKNLMKGTYEKCIANVILNCEWLNDFPPEITNKDVQSHPFYSTLYQKQLPMYSGQKEKEKGIYLRQKERKLCSDDMVVYVENLMEYTKSYWS